MRHQRPAPLLRDRSCMRRSSHLPTQRSAAGGRGGRARAVAARDDRLRRRRSARARRSAAPVNGRFSGPKSWPCSPRPHAQTRRCSSSAIVWSEPQSTSTIRVPSSAATFLGVLCRQRPCSIKPADQAASSGRGRTPTPRRRRRRMPRSLVAGGGDGDRRRLPPASRRGAPRSSRRPSRRCRAGRHRHRRRACAWPTRSPRAPP